jgi:hypothetical protein
LLHFWHCLLFGASLENPDHQAASCAEALLLLADLKLQTLQSSWATTAVDLGTPLLMVKRMLFVFAFLFLNLIWNDLEEKSKTTSE